METSRRAKGLDLSLQYGARSRNVGLTILFISDFISLYRLIIFFQSKYREFLLSAELVPEEEYDSDVDPTFIPPPIFELDFDYDEYSDGEIQVYFLTLYLRLTECLNVSYDLFLPNHFFFSLNVI